MNSIARYIDHTLLKPEATKEAVKKLCEEAVKFGFACVCVNPMHVPNAFHYLKESKQVKICTVVGFPLGANLARVKAFEAQQAILQGADEIDMVINQSLIKDQDWMGLENDIKEVKIACGDKILKVILETAHLNEEEIKTAAKIASQAGANYVKTSTGFGRGGASFEAVQLMKASIGEEVKIKASGGVRDLTTAKKYIELGVSRIGTSSGVALVQGQTSNSSY